MLTKKEITNNEMVELKSWSTNNLNKENQNHFNFINFEY